MPGRKEDVIAAIRNAEAEVERLVESAPEPAWSKGAYEQGWNAKQLLCHIASTSGVAGFLIAMAQASAGGGPGADFDVDSWNAQAVAERQDKAVEEIMEEARTNFRRDIAGVEAAPGDLLSRNFRAPWGSEGPLGDVIVASVQEHLMVHARDLARALG